jgi:phosphoglucomutase
MQIEKQILNKINSWLIGNYDNDTKSQIKKMLDNNKTEELIDAFYKDLEFGTGGLRGVMGVGTNRMNKYTVGAATQGFADYLKKTFPNKDLSVAIAYDCRHNNTYFANITADILIANGIKVYLFDELKPTPELSFAIRHLHCDGGIIITASHNPPEYNGYKVYWNDGAQLVSPHDKNVIDEVKKIQNPEELKFEGNDNLKIIIGEEVDNEYIKKVKELSLSPELIKKHKDFKIVYTPIHGTGVKLVPMALKAFGFENVINIPEQDKVDGDFPTVESPNPEEAGALEMAINKAKETNADLVMATDPDGDRVGIAVRKPNNEFILLNGNQTASLLFHYILSTYKAKGLLKSNQFMVKTIVTSELLNDISDDYGLEKYDVLTGFKYIADIIKKNEGKKKFILGGEESYGYLIGDFVRDKDAVSSCAMIAETAVWAADKGKSLYEILAEIYLKYGFYLESLKSVVRKGKSGADEIQEMMNNFRNNPPKAINNSEIIRIKDFQFQIDKDLKNQKESKIDLPKSNVIQFFTADGSKITMRPSGTEPKIKFYFGVKDKLDSIENYEQKYSELENRIENIIKDLGL